MIEKLNLWIEEVDRLTLLLNHQRDQPDSQPEPSRLTIFTTRQCSGNGRPRIGIDMDAVEYMLRLGYKKKEIAAMAGISIRTFIN